MLPRNHGVAEGLYQSKPDGSDQPAGRLRSGVPPEPRARSRIPARPTGQRAARDETDRELACEGVTREASCPVRLLGPAAFAPGRTPVPVRIRDRGSPGGREIR